MTDITSQRVHVSVNIEGTTNSSFLAELGNIYGSEHVLVYKLSQKKFIRLSEIPLKPGQSLIKMGKDLLVNSPLFNNNASDEKTSSQDQTIWYPRRDLPADTAAVHGHFTPSLFKGVIENPFISIVLKDPLERMISLYEEWVFAKGDVDWRVKIPFNKKTKFINFAVEEIFCNFQSRSLGNKRLGDYDLVGVAECQAGFIAQLKNKDWTGYVKQKSGRNQLERPKYKNLEITSDFLDHFQSINQMDYAIYQQAKEFMGYC
ncbi:MAG: hypothetical protein MUO54_16780 [Anaerolineales bacterium]|nr:hypothetical protein [Anaerolineales bacterium]